QIKDTQSSLSVSGQLSSSSSVSFVLAQLQQRHKSVQHNPAEKQEHLPVSQAPLQPQCITCKTLSGAGFLVIQVQGPILYERSTFSRLWSTYILFADDTLVMSMIRVLLPVPVKTYKLHGKSVCTLTAMTATSVSELLIMTALCSHSACCACKNNNRSSTTRTDCTPSLTVTQ